ncbi:MAG: ribosome maturation factor RimP [Tissierellia bacterium]|jgi:ribosome maturation factor RimP|nr:ribosome maturation factor RimP [Tissierellia bacterium]
MNRQELINKINEIVIANEMELVEVKIQSKTNPIIEIIIFKKDGVSLDDCTQISRAVESNINLDEYFPNNYNLEVASPGLDRKLTTLDDYRRNLDNKVEIKLYSKVNNQKDYVGILEDYDEEKIYLNVEDNILEIETNNIAIMRQYIDFGR